MTWWRSLPYFDNTRNMGRLIDTCLLATLRLSTVVILKAGAADLKDRTSDESIDADGAESEGACSIGPFHCFAGSHRRRVPRRASALLRMTRAEVGSDMGIPTDHLS